MKNDVEIAIIGRLYEALMSRAFFGAAEDWQQARTMRDFLKEQNDKAQVAANKVGLMEMKGNIEKAIEAMLRKIHPKAHEPIKTLQEELQNAENADNIVELMGKVLEATQMLRDDQPNPLYVKRS